MISTRFLPMSWTSPFTVARTILPRVGVSALLHELLEMVHAGLHRFGRLQHFRDDQLVVVEEPPDFGHAGHQRAIDDVERRGAFRALAIQIGNQAVLGALNDVVGQPFVERQVRRSFSFPSCRALRKCSVMAAMWN